MLRALAITSLLLVAETAVAQDAPAIDTSQPAAAQVSTYGGWFLSTVPGKVLLVLGGALVVVRGATAIAARRRDAPKRKVAQLLSQGRRIDAAELLMQQNRELEAAELYLQGGAISRAADVFQRNGRGKRAAEVYESAGLHSEAAKTFERLRHYKRAAKLHAKAGDLDAAERCFLEIADKPSIARMYAAASDHEKAAYYFAEASLPAEAALHLERLGRRVEAVASYINAYTVLTRSAVSDERAASELMGKIVRLANELRPDERYRFEPFLRRSGSGAFAPVVKGRGAVLPPPRARIPQSPAVSSPRPTARTGRP